MFRELRWALRAVWKKRTHREVVVRTAPWFLVLAAVAATAVIRGGREESAAGDRDPVLSWPSWRGPLATGEAPDADPPIRWSEGENVRFRVELPGAGHSTPVVAGDRLFLTAAVPFGERLDPAPFNIPPEHDNVGVYRRHRFVVVCLSAEDGRVLWQRTVREALPHEGGHRSASLASASPVTDGEVLVASFGSQGIYGLTLDGEVLWERDFGDMHTKHKHGEGSSPALFGDRVFVVWDHEGPSFIVALDKRTGETIWRRDRDEVTSWSSPIVVPHEGRVQVIANGTQRIRAYDSETGDVIWECGGLSHNIVASPVAADGWVFAGSSYEKKALLAIRLDGAEGDITGTDIVVWKRTRGTPYVPSPLLYDGVLYVLTHYQGVITGLDAKSGEVRTGPLRLPGVHEVYASLAAAAGRIYVVDRSGLALVLDARQDLRILAANRLDDRLSASPVMVGDTLYLRGERFLYALAEGR